MKEHFPIPQAQNVVGTTTEMNHEDLIERYGELMFDHKGNLIDDPNELLTKFFNTTSKEKYENFEIEKTSFDKEIIDIATIAIKKFANEFGRNTFIDLTYDHIHFFKEGSVDEFTKGRLAIGSHSTKLGEIIVERRTNLQTAITVFHELWHAIGSYCAIQVTTEGELDSYRSGITVKSRDGEGTYFVFINEGMTGYMTKRFVDEKLRNLSVFKEEIDSIEQSKEEVDTSRQFETEQFLELIEMLYKENTDKFSSKEEIRDLFLKAQVTGNILPIARLADSTFGKGWFRKLGELNK